MTTVQLHRPGTYRPLGRRVPTPPPGTPSPRLTFELPTGWRDEGPKVFTHVINPYWRSIDDRNALTDPTAYWPRNFLNATGEGGIHAAYGGIARDMPLPRAPIGTGFQVADATWDAEQMITAGFHGAFFDVLSTSASAQSNVWYGQMRDGFALASAPITASPQVDTNGTTIAALSEANISQLSARIAEWAYTAPVRGQTTGNTWRSTAFRLDDGRFVLGAWRAEGKPASWWTALMNDLNTAYGISCVLWATFLDWTTSSAYTSVVHTEGNWGDGADPNIARNAADKSATARARGHGWWAPIWAGDARPYTNPVPNGNADENHGTEALREYAQRAIREAPDAVLVNTWTDYREGYAFRPGIKAGYNLTDVLAYYLVRLKTGAYPPILRDGIWLAHRVQKVTTANRPATAAYRSGQTRQCAQWTSRNGEGPVLDEVEVLTHLLDPATVTVHIGAATHTYVAPAGVSAAYFPIKLGTIDAAAVRSGATVAQVTSPTTVTATPYHDDWTHYIYSSLPGATPGEIGQFNLDAWLPR